MGRLATVDGIGPLVIYLFPEESRFVPGLGMAMDGSVTI